MTPIYSKTQIDPIAYKWGLFLPHINDTDDFCGLEFKDEENNNLIGYLFLIKEEGESLAHSSIVINPAYRGQGFLQSMYKETLGYFGEEVIEAHIERGNKVSGEAHLKVGRVVREEGNKLVVRIERKDLTI